MKSYEKKVLALFIVAALCVGTLVGCGQSKSKDSSTEPSSNTESNSTTKPAGDKASGAAETSKFIFWTFAQSHADFFEAMANEWNTANPDRQIALDIQVMPYADMHNALTTAFLADSGAPDLVDIELGKFPNYLQGDIKLVSLNRIVEPELNNIVRSRVDIYSSGGNFYGIDYHVGASVMFYNKSMLDAVGIDPADLTTWDKFHEAGKTFYAATNKPFAVFQSGNEHDLLPKLSCLGGDVTTPDGTPTLNTPEMIKAIEFQQSMLADNTAVVCPGGDFHKEEFYGFFNNEGAAAMGMPFWYLNRFTDNMPDLKGKIVVAPLPVFEEGQDRSVGIGGTGTCVTTYCENQDVAVDFLAFAKLSEEGNKQIWNILGFDPIRTSVWSDPIMKATDNVFNAYFANIPAETLNAIKDEIPGLAVTSNTPQTLNIMQQVVLPSTIEQGQDAATVLADAQAQLEQELAQ